VIKYTTISTKEIIDINENNFKAGQRKLFKNPQNVLFELKKSGLPEPIA